MAKELKLSKKAEFCIRLSHEIEGVSYDIDLFTYYNASGFVHFARFMRDYDILADCKKFYLNRTWERFTGQSAFRGALLTALKNKDINEDVKEKLFKKWEL